MPTLRRARLGRFAQVLSLLALSCALTAPGAHAAPAKKAAKKQVAVAPVKKKAVKERATAAPQGKRVAKSARQPSRVAARSAASPIRAVAYEPRQSFGQMAGLHAVADPLDLKSSVALVLDQDTHEVLLSKNDHAVLPIGEMLLLALMSSENRAAHALGRTFPGGLDAFVQQMNAKARLLGMTDTRYVEPTGLSSRNQSSARDLAVLVNVAHSDPLVREYTTSPGYEVAVGRRTLQYNNTNRLVLSPTWDIGLQKTGYISEAGRCLVMQAQVAGRKIIMVFLDSAGKFSRLGDAERVRHWVESMGQVAGDPMIHKVKG
jgi:D-alanyl-D-alanine endopeptidase (penicillin-binding protein 7)